MQLLQHTGLPNFPTQFARSLIPNNAARCRCMSCLWQGSVHSVFWPNHEPPIVSLPLEMWWASEHHERETNVSQFPNARLEFDKYTHVRDTSFWEICGPEITVMTRDVSCHKYFSEFASMQHVLLRLAVKSDQPLAFTHFVLFAACEDNVFKLLARPVNTTISPPKRVPAIPSRKPPTSPGINAAGAAALAACEQAPPPSSRAVPNVKTALQQTLMAALRLRKIRSSDPRFKKIYYSVQSLVELSLQKVDESQISLELIHDKVEAILSVTD